MILNICCMWLDRTLEYIKQCDLFRFLRKQFIKFWKYLQSLSENKKKVIWYICLALWMIFFWIPFINWVIFLLLAYELLWDRIKDNKIIKKIFKNK